MKKYRLAAVGGTFDRLHKGHKALLAKTFSVAEKAVIGITSDEMVRGKLLSQTIETYDKRRQEVIDFLAKKKFKDRAVVVKLNNPYGSLKTNSDIEVLVVGPRYTEKVVASVKNNMDVVFCKNIVSTDGKLLSSSRVRKGEVNREGALYNIPKKTLILPRSLRPKLRMPMGKLITKSKIRFNTKTLLVCAVGDVSTKRLKHEKLDIDIAIIDYRVRRKKRFASLGELGLERGQYSVVYASNNAGTITQELFESVRSAYKKWAENRQKTIITVNGEEDLTVLPAVYLAPLGATIVYGQPPVPNEENKGLVMVTVDEEKKQQTKKLLGMFSC